MKIRTDTEFFDRIDNDLSWRKADLIRLKDLIFQNKGNLFGKTLLRSAIPMLYAHWEGFVKESASCYFAFISTKRLKYREHLIGIQALYIKAEYLRKESETNYQKALQICNFFATELDHRKDIHSIPTPIDTKSNLNSEVLKEIMEILNLDYSKFAAYEVLINSKLLEARNKIAHGEYRDIDLEFYIELNDVIFKLIDSFRDEIENAVALKQYKNEAS